MRPTDFIRLAVFILALITPAFAQTDPDARGGAAEAEALTRLGLEYAKSGQYSKAVEALKQAIRLDPEAAEGHYLLGATYNNMGRHDEAVEAFEEAVRLRPSWGEAYGGLVLCNHNSWSEVQGSRLSVSGPKALQT